MMVGRRLRVVQMLLALVLLSLLVACELTIECRNGKVFHISTRGGICRTIEIPHADTPGGIEIVGGVCNAGSGNKAYVTCGGGCRYVTGSGSCEIVSEAIP
jgi:hypothetical protein